MSQWHRLKPSWQSPYTDGGAAREASVKKHPVQGMQKHWAGAAVWCKLMQSWAGKCANRWLMWLSYSQLSQAASKWTWTGLVQFSATENQTDLAMQLLSRATASNPNSPGTVYRTQNVLNSQYPPFASICRTSKEEYKNGFFFSSLLTHNIPFFLNIRQPLQSKRKTKNSFSLAHQSGGMGKQTWFPAQTVNQTEPWQ